MRLLFALLALIAAPALADNHCYPHPVVSQGLAEKYGETRRVIAIDRQGAVIEFYGSDNGTWTIVITQPGGLSCMVAAGEYHEQTNEPMPPLGQDG